jgi:hypothetical protein
MNSRVAPSQPCYRPPMTMAPPDGKRTIFADDPDDDTIEMVFSPEDMRLLSRAAEEQQREARLAESTSSGPPADQPAAPTSPPSDSAPQLDTSQPRQPPPASQVGASQSAPPVPAARIDAPQPPPSPTTAKLSARTAPPTNSTVQTRTPTPAPVPGPGTTPAPTHSGTGTVASRPPQDTAPTKPQARNFAMLTKGALAGATGALAIVLAISSWHTGPVTTKSDSTVTPGAAPAATPVAAPAPATAVPAPATESQQPAESPLPSAPVRVRNPFDKSETFEFPPGTTLYDARQSVADVLLQRARDRRGQPVGMRRSRVNGAPAPRTPKSTDLAQNSTRHR